MCFKLDFFDKIITHIMKLLYKCTDRIIKMMNFLSLSDLTF